MAHVRIFTFGATNVSSSYRTIQASSVLLTNGSTTRTVLNSSIMQVFHSVYLTAGMTNRMGAWVVVYLQALAGGSPAYPPQGSYLNVSADLTPAHGYGATLTSVQVS